MRIEIWIMILSTLSIVGVDIWLAVDNKRNTFSELLRRYAFKHPAIPFAFGALMGHFFWCP